MNAIDKTKTFLMIVLTAVIIVFATTLFFTYKTKSFINKKVKTDELVITETTKNYLINLVPFLGDSEVFYDDNIFSKKKTLVSEVDNNILYEMALNTLNSIPDDEDLEGNYGWMCYERDLFDNKIKEMYNISSNTVSRPTLSELGDAKKIYPMENKVCITHNSNQNPGNVISSIYKTKKENKNIVIYAYSLFEDCIKENSVCDGWNVYSDSKLNNKIDEYLFDEDISDDDIINKHYEEAGRYKHTFKPIEIDGKTKYYWYSTEKLE